LFFSNQQSAISIQPWKIIAIAFGGLDQGRFGG